MKKLFALMLALLVCVAVPASTALAERDWAQLMTMPTQEQLAQPGTFRSPYVTFLPDFDRNGFTGCAMDIRIPFDPRGTYICPACFNLDTSVLEETYDWVWSDYGSQISGYFGFQVLEEGEKVIIMSMWDALCMDEDENVTLIKPRVLSPENAWITDHTPETNGEGSFIQCIVPFEWETGRDYRCLLEQKTSEQGTELFTLSITDLQGEGQSASICFDSCMPGVWMNWVGGFVENFDTDMAAWPRALEFWNVRFLTRSTGEWEYAETVRFDVNNSLGITDYEGSWNVGVDDRSCWIITSGIPGLCQSPKKMTEYKMPATESAEPN